MDPGPLSLPLSCRLVPKAARPVELRRRREALEAAERVVAAMPADDGWARLHRAQILIGLADATSDLHLMRRALEDFEEAGLRLPDVMAPRLGAALALHGVGNLLHDGRVILEAARRYQALQGLPGLGGDTVAELLMMESLAWEQLDHAGLQGARERMRSARERAVALAPGSPVLEAMARSLRPVT